MLLKQKTNGNLSLWAGGGCEIQGQHTRLKLRISCYPQLPIHGPVILETKHHCNTKVIQSSIHAKPEQLFSKHQEECSQ